MILGLFAIFYVRLLLRSVTTECWKGFRRDAGGISLCNKNRWMFPETINCSELTKRVLSFILIENGPSVFVSASKFPLKSRPLVVSSFTGYTFISFSLWRWVQWNRYIQRTITEMLRFCLRTNGTEIQCIDWSTSILEIDTVIDWWLCDSIPV